MKMTVLLSARRNSKYLAKFLFGLMENTDRPGDLTTYVMLSEHDEWNRELVGFADRGGFGAKVWCQTENMQLGRAGLHRYFNELLKQGYDDWVVYFCEDHFINVSGWDTKVEQVISGELVQGDSEGKQFPLDPSEPWVIVPKFDNCGAMNHIVSRGFIEALGGVIGNHGWIDSYINDLMREFPERVIRMDDELFHDFTHDQPTPMHDSHVQALSTEKGKLLPAYEDQRVKKQIEQDQIKLRRALK